MNVRYTLVLSLALATIVAPRLAATPNCNGMSCYQEGAESHETLEDGHFVSEAFSCPGEGCLLQRRPVGSDCATYFEVLGENYYCEPETKNGWVSTKDGDCDGNNCDTTGYTWEPWYPVSYDSCWDTQSCNPAV